MARRALSLQAVMRIAALLTCLVATAWSDSVGAQTPVVTPIPPYRVPPALAAAIAGYVEANLGEYAGDCNETVLDEDVGKWCSGVIELSADEALVGLGLAFSDGGTSVRFQLTAEGDWVVADSTPLPPVVGSGNASDPDPLGAAFLWAGGVVVLIAGALVAVFARRRPG